MGESELRLCLMQEWQQIERRLSEKVTNLREQIKEHKHLCFHVASKLKKVKRALLLHEAKLVTRNARPGAECKVDSAEESLQFAVVQMQLSQAELKEHIQQLEATKGQLREELMLVEGELRDANAARIVDTHVHKKIELYGTYL